MEVNGRTKIALRGQISNYIPNPTFSVVAKPGAWEEYFKFGNPEGKSRRELFGEPMRAIPAFFEPGPRLELMDELGLDRSLMFPTLASLVEERLRDDPLAIHVIVHSLNQWLDEVWGFNYQNRIFTTPVITLPIVEKAIEEPVEHRVEVAQRVELRHRHPPPHVRDPRPQQGVGEHPHAALLDEHRGVPHVRQRAHDPLVGAAPPRRKDATWRAEVVRAPSTATRRGWILRRWQSGRNECCAVSRAKSVASCAATGSLRCCPQRSSVRAPTWSSSCATISSPRSRSASCS